MIKYTILCIFIFNLSYSQIVTVVDRESRQPLEMVNISSKKPAVFLTTNNKGQADITALKNAAQIQFNLMGYKLITVSYEDLRKNNFIAELKTETFTLEQVVISASKWNQNSRNITSSVASIKPREAALLNPQSAADLLGGTGEVFIQKSQQGGGSPMIRGFATNRLLYSIDGVRMNTAIFRSGNIQNVISLDPFAIENTEILFGPSSLIYGSDAIGGVMSFQTLSPKHSFTDKTNTSGSVVTRYSSANQEMSGHFHVNLGWKKWAFVTSYSSQNYDDLRMGSYGPEEYLRRFYVQRIDSVDRIIDNPDPQIQNPTAYSQSNFMQKVKFTPNARFSFEYAYHHSATTPYGRYDRLIELQSNGYPRSAVWNYGPQIWSMNFLSMTHTSQNILYDVLKVTLAQQYFEESRIDRNFSGSNRFRLRTQLEKVYAYSANADFLKSFKKNTLFYGFEGVSNIVRSEGSGEDIRNGADVPVPDRYPQSEWYSVAAYANYQANLSEKFIAQGGLRYNLYGLSSDFTDNQPFFPTDYTVVESQNASLTSTLGFVYNTAENNALRINFSSGFRAPNVDDMGKLFELPQGIVIVPNPDLMAEKAYNAEIGMAHIFKNMVRIDVSAFYTYLDDAMVRRDFQVNGQDSIMYDGEFRRVQAIQNAAYAFVYGFQAELEVKLPEHFSVSGKINYQVGKEEMDNGEVSPSRHAAPLFGLARLTYQYQKLNIQFYSTFSGGIDYEDLNIEEQFKPAIYAVDQNGNPYSPSWYTLNIKAMYQLTDLFSVSGGVENLSDQRYRPYSSGLTAAGRNFVISLRATF